MPNVVIQQNILMISIKFMLEKGKEFFLFSVYSIMILHSFATKVTAILKNKIKKSKSIL